MSCDGTPPGVYLEKGVAIRSSTRGRFVLRMCWNQGKHATHGFAYTLLPTTDRELAQGKWSKTLPSSASMGAGFCSVRGKRPWTKICSPSGTPSLASMSSGNHFTARWPEVHQPRLAGASASRNGQEKATGYLDGSRG